MNMATAKNAEELTSELSQDIKALRDEIGGLIESTKDEAVARAKSAAHIAGEAAGEVGRAVRDTAAEARRRGEAAANEFEALVADRPIVSVAVAMAAGFLLAKLTR
jgi:ElaB/YqjD/DUF883 family membrane-anchored ribosome-binding protein